MRAALHRRTGLPAFALDELVIDYRARRTSLVEPTLELAATEHACCALQRRGVYAYDDLARSVWSHRERVDSKLVRAYIRRLRPKLGDDPDAPVYIFSERGVGYCMPAPPPRG